jgi:hypothetical protein
VEWYAKVDGAATTIHQDADTDDFYRVTLQGFEGLTHGATGGQDVIDDQYAAPWRERGPAPELASRSVVLPLRIGRIHAKLPCNLEREDDTPGCGTSHDVDTAFTERVREPFTGARGRCRLTQEIELLHITVAVTA